MNKLMSISFTKVPTWGILLLYKRYDTYASFPNSSKVECLKFLHKEYNRDKLLNYIKNLN